MPYRRLVETADYIASHLDDSTGVTGMLKVAKWLSEKGTETNLEQLYSAFGGEGKIQAVVQILIGRTLSQNIDLKWKNINMPYKRLVETADYIAVHLEEST